MEYVEVPKQYTSLIAQCGISPGIWALLVREFDKQQKERKAKEK